MKDFQYDMNDYHNTPELQRPWNDTRPFLVPVFFEKEALFRYLFDSRYKCEFCSESYGTIYYDEADIPFGINPNNKVVMWLGDLDVLPEKETLYLLSHNIASDHNIQSEFYEAQINAQFTEPMKEASILVSKNKINSLLNEKCSFKLFKTEYQDVDALFRVCSKYKKIFIGGVDDFKRIISEWNEILIEDILSPHLKEFLTNKNVSLKKGEKSIKLLEKFIGLILEEDQNIIEAYFILYDLRIWADHADAQSKFEDSIKRLGLSGSPNFLSIYQTLISRVTSFHDQFIESIKNYTPQALTKYL